MKRSLVFLFVLMGLTISACATKPSTSAASVEPAIVVSEVLPEIAPYDEEPFDLLPEVSPVVEEVAS